jgi:hypothetical protein
MASGREALSFPQLPKDIPAKQMLAAVGQPRLMALYEKLFGLFGITVAQVLLTRTDLANRRSYLNARNTLSALLAHRILPVVNENDTVATEEIRVGDNDNLSALVTNLVEADTLILLTDQPGLFTADPRQDLAPDVTSQTESPLLWKPPAARPPASARRMVASCGQPTWPPLWRPWSWRAAATGNPHSDRRRRTRPERAFASATSVDGRKRYPGGRHRT